jgi:uncharacterized protein (DUF58 family)
MEGQHKIAVLSLLLIGFLLIGLLARREELLLLAIPVAVHLAMGLALASDTGHPQFVATKTMVRPLIREHDTTEVQVELENRGQGLEIVEIDDLLPEGLALEDGFCRAVDSMDHEGRLTLTYTVRARRGLYSFSTVRMRAGDLLGYMVWRREVPCPAALTVLPHYEELSGIEIRPPRTLIHSGTIRSRRPGEGIEFFGTREYVPGDNLRRLDWKAYARLGRLVINEYEEERASHVTVVLDARELVNRYRGEESLFDYSVRAAAAVSHYFLKNGNRVGLLTYGTYLDWVFPGYGHRHNGCIMRALARAGTGTTLIFEQLRYLPTRLFPAGSQLILISPLIPGDEEVLCLLQIKGYRVLVISPDTLSFEIKGLEDTPEVHLAKRILSLKRSSMFRRLSAAGVRWLEWDVRSPLAPQLKAICRRVK